MTATNIGNLEGKIILRDEFTAVLRKVATELGKANSRIGNVNKAFKRTADEIKRSGDASDKAAQKIITATQNIEKQTVKTAKEIEKANKRAAKSQDKLAVSMKRAGREMQSVGRSLTLHVTAPLLAAGAASIKMSNDFGLSMAKIENLVGVQRTQVEGFKDDILSLAEDSGRGPRKLAEAMFFITSAGQRGAVALSTLTASAKASAIGMGSTKVVADAATSAMNAYGETNLSASQAVNILTLAVRKGKLEASELAPTMGRMVPIAAALDIKFHDIAGVMAVMSRTGLEAFEASTALSAIMTTLLGKSTDGARALREVGMSYQGLRQQAAGPGGLISVMRTLDEAFKGNDEQLMRVVPNIRAFRGVMNALAQDVSSVDEVMGEIKANVNILDSGMTRLSEESGFRLQQFFATLKVRLLELGDALVPTFNSLLDVGNKLLNWMSSLTTAFQSLDPVSKNFVVFVTAVAALAGPATIALGLLASAVGALTAAVSGLTLVSGPFIVALTAIGAVLLVTASTISQYKSRLDDLMATDIEFFNKLAQNGNIKIAIDSGDIQVMKGRLGELSDEQDKWQSRLETASEEIKRLHKAIKTGGRSTAHINKKLLSDWTGKLNEAEIALDKVKAGQKSLQKAVSDFVPVIAEAVKETKDRTEAQIEAARVAKILEGKFDEAMSGMRAEIGRTTQALEMLKEGVPLAEVEDLVDAAEALGLVDLNSTIVESMADLTGAARKANNELEDMIENLSFVVGAEIEIPEFEIPIPDVSDMSDEAIKAATKQFEAYEEEANKSRDKMRDIFGKLFEDIADDGQIQWKKMLTNIGANWARHYSDMLSDMLHGWAKALAKKLKMWIAEITKEKAVEAGAGLGSSSSSGGGGVDAGQVAGVASGASAGTLATVAGVAAVVGIVGLIGVQQGWWGAKGSEAVGGVVAGGSSSQLEVIDTFANRAENIKVVLEKVKEAMKTVTSFTTEMALEIDRFQNVTLEKRDKTYVLTDALGRFEILKDATAEQIADAVATMSIRQAEFGDSVSDFVAAVIHASSALSTEQLAAEIDFARMVEGFGKPEIESKLQDIGSTLGDVFQKVIDILGNDVEQMSAGLLSTVREEASRWEAARREATGEQITPAEQLANMQAKGRIFNAEKAIRILDLQAQRDALEAQSGLNRISRLEERRYLQERGQLVRADVELSSGWIQQEFTRIEAREDLLGADLQLSGAYNHAMQQMIDSSAASLQAQLGAIDELIASLEGIADIDIGNIRLPGGGGRGGQRRNDQSNLSGMIDNFLVEQSLVGMAEYEASMARINIKWDEAIPLAHGNVELLDNIARARMMELNALRESKKELFRQNLADFIGGPGGLAGAVAGIRDQAQALRDEFALLDPSMSQFAESAREMGQIAQAEADKIRDLAQNAIASLAHGLVSIIDDQEINQNLQAQWLIIEHTLKMAQFRAEYEALIALGQLTQAQMDAFQAAFAWIDENAANLPGGEDWVPPPFPGSGSGSGSGGGGGTTSAPFDDTASRIEALMRQVQQWNDLALSPAERQLEAINRQYAEMIAEAQELGIAVGAITAAYNIAIDDFWERMLSPIRDFRDSLNLSNLSPLTGQQQFDQAQSNFQDLAARAMGGDLEALQQITAAAQDYLQAAAGQYGTAGAGYADIFAQVQAMLASLLGETAPGTGTGSGGVDDGGIKNTGPGAPPVLPPIGPGDVGIVDGFGAVGDRIATSNSAQTELLRELVIETIKTRRALEDMRREQDASFVLGG